MKIFNRQQKHKMQTSTAMVTRPMHLDTPIDYAERSGAAFLPTLESHVFVPLADALISGLFAGIPAGLLVLSVMVIGGLGWGRGLQGAALAMLLIGYVVAWWSWSGHLNDYKSLLWYTEFAEGPEQPKDNKQTYRADVKINQNWVHADLPFDRDNPKALVDFAHAVVSNLAPFSERGAGRYGYSVARFNELRDGFIKGHLAYWKNPQNRREGIALSRSGLALLKSVADNPPPDNYEPADDWGMTPQIVQK